MFSISFIAIAKQYRWNLDYRYHYRASVPSGKYLTKLSHPFKSYFVLYNHKILSVNFK